MIEGGTDCGGFSFADNEHAGRMGTRTVGGKRPVVARLGGVGRAGRAGGRMERIKDALRLASCGSS